MHLSVFVYLLSWCGLCSAFFLWKDKGQPIFLCLKICPLYCPKNRRQDDDSSLVFFDNSGANMKTLGNRDDILSPRFVVRCKPTTSSAPQLKSNDSKPFLAKHLKYDEASSTYYQNFESGLSSEDTSSAQDQTQPSSSPVDCKWESSTTTKESTTNKDNRRYDDDTSSHLYVDHDSPYVFAEDIHDYEVFPHPHYYWHHKLKTTSSTKPSTAAPTTTPGHIFDEDIRDYDFFPHPHIYWHHWDRTTPKPITAAPTTPEPTYICQLCKSKCA